MSVNCTVDAWFYGNNLEQFNEGLKKIEDLWSNEYGWNWDETEREDCLEEDGTIYATVETECKNGVNNFVDEILPILKEYHISGKFSGETFEYLDEGYIEIDDGNKIIEDYFSFYDAIPEDEIPYDDETESFDLSNFDWDTFFENMKECAPEGIRDNWNEDNENYLREIITEHIDEEGGLQSCIYWNLLWGDEPLHWYFREYY